VAKLTFLAILRDFGGIFGFPRFLGFFCLVFNISWVVKRFSRTCELEEKPIRKSRQGIVGEVHTFAGHFLASIRSIFLASKILPFFTKFSKF
jgi:hypothetical protein